MNIKKELYDQCLDIVNSRLQNIHDTITEIQQALLSETKSSVGDKHETGRDMLQLEREKAGNQLVEIKKTQQILSKINIENISKTIGVGCVVYTTKANYFIAISAGELTINNYKFYAISVNSPIGKELLGKTKGDEIIFRTEKFLVTDIL